uniref:Calponin-homology (CH) domain-containing protein n=1 Tax=Heligmosomoides polygyrus TaxID=6339 RepID=A0A183F8R5_HELPZ
LVDVTALTLPSRAVEMHDGLNMNEIIVQFMAYKCLHKHDIIPVRKVFFTLQFYRFQQITTEQ